MGPADDGFTQKLVDSHAKPDESAFRMLSVGLDGLAARLELIEHAQRGLHLQYYIFRADESGSLVARALLAAADRGVRVRILVDDGETVAGDERLFALAAHPAIQVRVFNPFDYRGHGRVPRALDFLLHKSRLDHRMHNKLMVADNALALIGGRNIGDQYFQIDPDSQFGDDDVVAHGPIVAQLSAVYDLFWNSEQAVPIQAIDPRHSSPEALAAFRAGSGGTPIASTWRAQLDQRLAAGAPLAGWLMMNDPFVSATAQLIYDSPDKAAGDGQARFATQIYPGFAARAEHATHEILMVSPYFVPSPSELSMLREVRARAVRVSVLTNSLEAAPNVVAQAGAAAAFICFTMPSALLLYAWAVSSKHLAGPIGPAVMQGLNLVAVAVVAQSVLGMARLLTPDVPRALLAVAAAIAVAVSGTAGMQLAAILAGAALGPLIYRHTTARGGGNLQLRYGRGTGAALLMVFGALLILALSIGSSGPAMMQVACAFYRTGALVFGGGHVVLPLLKQTIVDPGWIDDTAFLSGYGAAQAVPGPLFSVAAFLGQRLSGGHGGVAGALVSLVAIFLPGLLLVAGVLPY